MIVPINAVTQVSSFHFFTYLMFQSALVSFQAWIQIWGKFWIQLCQKLNYVQLVLNKHQLQKITNKYKPQNEASKEDLVNKKYQVEMRGDLVVLGFNVRAKNIESENFRSRAFLFVTPSWRATKMAKRNRCHHHTHQRTAVNGQWNSAWVLSNFIEFVQQQKKLPNEV